MEKYCYICLPIAGRENDVFERAERAKNEVERLGYIPICPLDLNKIGEKELVNHTEIQMTAWYMGRDIDMIIRDCDAIYCCEGWEYSKGCNVERECAKQYKRDVLYQISYDERNDLKFIDVINKKHQEIINKYVKYSIAENRDSDMCKHLSRQLKEYENFCMKNFGMIFDKDEYNLIFE